MIRRLNLWILLRLRNNWLKIKVIHDDIKPWAGFSDSILQTYLTFLSQYAHSVEKVMRI
jgi:hypothetical protein